MQTIIHLIEMYIVIRLIIKGIRLFTGKSKSKNISKVHKLISNRVGYWLDDMLKRQTKKRYRVLHHTKVIDLKRYKKASGRA